MHSVVLYKRGGGGGTQFRPGVGGQGGHEDPSVVIESDIVGGG